MRSEIQVNQVLASPLAGGIHRLYLRVHGENATPGIRFAQIIGPGANSEIASAADRLVWRGDWAGLHYRCTCWLHPSGSGWFFHLELENRTASQVRCDAVLLQDIGLATRGQVRSNEIFTSQYLDHTAIADPEAGYILMSRQNLVQPGETHPWLLQGCFPQAKGFVTDGFDFFGVESRRDGVPRALSKPVIGNRVRQYEAAYTGIQSNDIGLPPAATHAWTFFAHFLADHPEPTLPADADRLRIVRQMCSDLTAAIASRIELPSRPPLRSIFQTCDLFGAEDFDAADLARHFPGARRHEESAGGGKLLSFFHADDAHHVVLQAKEVAGARPHGTIMRAGRGYMPDAELMSSGAYSAGVFASQLSLGNTSFGRLLSTMRDPLNLVRSSGLRMLVRHGATDVWQQLAVPSAFEMWRDGARWYYKRAEELLTVTCAAAGDDDPAFEFQVRSQGKPVQWLICGEIAGGPTEYETSPRRAIDASRRAHHDSSGRKLAAWKRAAANRVSRRYTRRAGDRCDRRG